MMMDVTLICFLIVGFLVVYESENCESEYVCDSFKCVYPLRMGRNGRRIRIGIRRIRDWEEEEEGEVESKGGSDLLL